MKTYEVLAQCMVGSDQIKKTVRAWSKAEALRMVSQDLNGCSYYVVDIKEIR